MDYHEIENNNNVYPDNDIIQQNLKPSYSISSCDSNIGIKSMPILKTSYPNKSEKLRPAGDILMELEAVVLSDKNEDNFNEITIEPDAVPIRDGRTLVDDKQRHGDDVIDAVPTRDDRKLVEDKVESNCSNEMTSSKETIRKQSIHDNASTMTSESYQGNDATVTCATLICILFQFEYLFSRYSAVDLILTIGSIGLYIFDSVTDVLNGLAYYFNYDEQNQDNLLYFYLTMVFIIIPSLIMQVFSIWWELEDSNRIKKKKEELGRKVGSRCLYIIIVSLPHILQVAPIFRYIRSAYFGIKSRIKELQGNENRRNFYHKRWKYELCDVNFLRLFESFLESGTQLVLQIYIMLRTQQTPFITVLSCSVSLFGIAAVFVAYQRALRDSHPEEKNQISIIGSIVLFLYRTCTILSRVLALALLLNVHIWAWIGLFLFHWLCMSIWVSSQNTMFCKSRAGEFVYDVVIGFCYNFAYINVHQGPHNKYKMLVYYIIMAVENIAMALSWFYLRKGGGSLIDALFGKTNFENFDVTSATMLTSNESFPDDIALVLVLMVPVLLLVGVGLMLFYYGCLHPKPVNKSEQLPDAKINLGGLVNVVTMRPHCGDNYRSQRKSPLFRSWHSGYDEFYSDVNFETKPKVRKRRPRSEILLQGEVTTKPLINKEQPDVNKEIVVKIEPVSKDSKKRFRTASEEAKYCLNSTACSCYSLRHSSHVYNTTFAPKSDLNTDSAELTFEKLRKDFVGDTEAEVKMREVEIKLEQKQREKMELEKRKKQLLLSTEKRSPVKSSLTSPIKPSGFGPQDLFNRRDRAKYFYTESLPVPEHDDLFPNLEMSTLHQKRLSGCNSGITNVTFSGTFPRRSKSQIRQNTYPLNKRVQQLKPICENKASTYSASLTNISNKVEVKRKVPRATSFSVSHNEELVSIESSL